MDHNGNSMHPTSEENEYIISPLKAQSPSAKVLWVLDCHMQLKHNGELYILLVKLKQEIGNIHCRREDNKVRRSVVVVDYQYQLPFL
jgi:hypothetical protein